MKEASHKAVYLEDYTPPPYLITHVYLDFLLGEEVTVVTSRLQFIRNPGVDDPGSVLELDGENLKLNYVELDGQRLDALQLVHADQGLRVLAVPEKFELNIQTEITPQSNTSLEGLYESGGNFCTQCEAQGFRKITYFLDRPDVMSRYTVRIQADKARYPVLLSNGNPVEQGDCDDGQHYAVWEDPFPKPCYLFALVAADLVYLEGSYHTESGKDIALRIYTEQHNLSKCAHALRSLQKAMRWDEQRFGLECDLDIYMIVAVDDFNMGAMENKGLNIFNSSCVLARPDAATDADYMTIEAVVAHEYFHNWTGNRVTCRDWFQLSLKEGLTVFRDQEFTSDVTSRAAKRISDVRYLRTYQFAEDAGPMAHPVRPASYQEINNFYTLTVYEKGAEIVRMYQTMFGAEGFRRGMELYFQRHDGQAVTTEDFAAAMGDANATDLTQFTHWYDQAGTPELDVEGQWNQASNTYRLEFRQSCPAGKDDESSQPLVMPVKASLLGSTGKSLPLESDPCCLQGATDAVLLVKDRRQTFVFENIKEKPLPDLLQDFSAPVRMRFNYTDEQLAFLLKHSPDAFNRWNAGNRLALNVLLGWMVGTGAVSSSDSVSVLNEALAYAIRSGQPDRSLLAELLVLPDERDLEEYVDPIDVQKAVSACDDLSVSVARHLEQDLLRIYQSCYRGDAEYRYNAEEMARRGLQNVSLQLLVTLNRKEYRKLALNQFVRAGNMTEQAGAVKALLHLECEEREQVLASFERQWKHDTLVMDKWLAFHALSRISGVLENVENLMQHSVFNLQNPNKVHALIGVFAGRNPYAFHQPDGRGYEFVARQVIVLDELNPQVASRLARSLIRWQKFTGPYRQKMYEQLEYIASHQELSGGVYEIVSKSLKPST